MTQAVNIPYAPHDGQLKLHRSNARFKIAPCGRRFGKTLGASAEILRDMVLNVGDYGWIAPTSNHCKRGLDEMRSLVNNDYFKIVESYPKQVVCSNGSKLYYLSADEPDAVRGYGFKKIVIDEAQKITERAYQYAIEPTISQTKGEALIVGTPFGRGLFYNLYMRGLSDEYPDYESFNFPSVSNPYFPQDEWERIKVELPQDAFRQEYMAEFLDDSAGVFRNIKACISDIEPNTSNDINIGCDVAKVQDYTVCTALCNKTGRVIDIDRFNQLDWTVAKPRIKSFADKYRGKVVLDATGAGDPIYDDLKKAGVNVVPFKFTNSSKKELVQTLSVAIEQREISWHSRHSVLTDELERYEYKISETTKNITYNAPAGYHDDCVMSLGLAVWEMKNEQPFYWSL
jgi:hypothetical protein